MSSNGQQDTGTSIGGTGGPNTFAAQPVNGFKPSAMQVGVTEPSRRRFTPPSGLGPPNQTSTTFTSSTFWYEFWDTPFIEDYRGKGSVRPSTGAYSLNNMPSKYEFATSDGLAMPLTTRINPVDPQEARIPYRKIGGAFFAGRHGDPPYPPGSLALDFPVGSTPPTPAKVPFDVQACLKYLGDFSADPDPSALPNPEGISVSLIKAGRGTLPVFRHILEASGVPYSIVSGFRPQYKPRECPLFEPIVFEQVFQFDQFNQPSYKRAVGTGATTTLRSDGSVIGEGMQTADHMHFNAVDVRGAGGTQAELGRLLTFIRQFPDLFQVVMQGEMNMSVRKAKPDAQGRRFGYNGSTLAFMPFHGVTGRREKATYVIEGGKRFERSPILSTEYLRRVAGNIGGQGADGLADPGGDPFSELFVQDYDRSEYVTSSYYTSVTSGNFELSQYCCWPDRIHIFSTVSFLRDGLRGYLIAQQEAAGKVFNKPIRKPGNSPVKPTPGMAYPPIITTDLPINDFASALNNQYSFGGTGSNFTLGVVRVPRGFHEAEFADGLAVMFRLKYPSGAFETRDRFQFGFHKPATNVKGISQGWKVLDAPDAGPTYVGVLGAQRRGEWVYGIAQQTFQGGQRRTQFVERMNSTTIRERRQHDDGTYYEGLGGAASGVTTDSFMPATNMDLFVSDHFPPQLFYMSGFTAGKTSDINGKPLAYHWVAEDQRGFGSGSTLPFYPSHRFKYEFWHTFQNLEGTGPANTQYPSLVFPWRCGDYDPPEMWFFVPEQSQSSTFTGRLKIYRSTYRKGNWKIQYGPITLTSTWQEGDPRARPRSEPDQDVYQDTGPGGGTGSQAQKPFYGDYVGNWSYLDTQQEENPENFGYASNWYSDANLVGIVGPFRAVTWGEQRNSGNASERVFRVVRDPRRKDRLHLAMFTTGTIFPPGQNEAPRWDGIWFASSDDDGKTWGRTKQMSPFVEHRPPDWQAGPYGASPQLAVTNGGDLIGLAQATFKGEQQQSLVAINWSGGGIINDYERRNVIFRDGST